MSRPQQLIMIFAMMFFSVNVFAITGTTSLMATFNSTVTSGTCKSMLHDAHGDPSQTLDFGDIYITDIASGPTEKFAISLTECQAVSKVVVMADASSECSGDSHQGAGFANSNGDARGVSVELWSGDAGTGEQFICSNLQGQEFAIAGDAVDLPMSARLAIVEGYNPGTLMAGSFDTTLTLLVTYQ